MRWQGILSAGFHYLHRYSRATTDTHYISLGRNTKVKLMYRTPMCKYLLYVAFPRLLLDASNWSSDVVNCSVRFGKAI